MNQPQPKAAEQIATASVGDEINVLAWTFKVCTVELSPFSKLVDPVFLDLPTAPGHASNVNEYDETNSLYHKLYTHVRDGKTGDAVVDRARMIEMLETGDYTIG